MTPTHAEADERNEEHLQEITRLQLLVEFAYRKGWTDNNKVAHPLCEDSGWRAFAKEYPI